MGTDIHAELEFRKKGDTDWHWIGEFLPDYISTWDIGPCTDRCYLWFGLLGDVRNGYGFADCDLGEPVEPIAPRRGFPEDISEALSKEVNSAYILGDHSYSWVHMDELKDFDGNNVGVTQRRYTNQEGYKQHLNKPGSMRFICGGGNFDVISNEEMRELIENNAATEAYTLVEWTQPVIKALPWDIYWSWRNLDIYLSSVSRGDYEVRVVFGFDS